MPAMSYILHGSWRDVICKLAFNILITACRAERHQKAAIHARAIASLISSGRRKRRGQAPIGEKRRPAKIHDADRENAYRTHDTGIAVFRISIAS